MKKLIVLSILLLAGCGFLKDQKAAFDACKSDPVCMEQAEAWKETGKLVGTSAGSFVPGVSPVSGLAGSYIALVIAMIILGKGVLKEKSK